MENPYSAIYSGAGFAVNNASMLHEALQKPNFRKLYSKEVDLNNPYLDLSSISEGQNELDSYSKEKKEGIKGNAFQGASTGASAGAAIGTAIMPGIGTAVGAIGGALYGAQIGLITGLIGNKKAKNRAKERQAVLDKNLMQQIDSFNTANTYNAEMNASYMRSDKINEMNYLNAMKQYG
jgi:phage tail tape-measure protein